MTKLDLLIKYSPYIVLIIFCLGNFPSSVIIHQYKSEKYFTYARKFNILCELATLPFISGMLGASSIFLFIKKNSTELNELAWVLIITATFAYFIVMLFIISFIWGATLTDRDNNIHLPFLLKKNVDYYLSSKILKIIGVLAPALVDLVVQLS